MLRSRRVGLLVAFEYLVQSISGNANALVDYADFQTLPAIRVMATVGQRECDLACLGELDCVADKIEENLAQRLRISATKPVRLLRLRYQQQVQPLALGAAGVQSADVTAQRPYIKAPVGELHSPGFDLLEV